MYVLSYSILYTDIVSSRIKVLLLLRPALQSSEKQEPPCLDKAHAAGLHHFAATCQEFIRPLTCVYISFCRHL